MGSDQSSPTFAALLRRARQVAGMTQEELAERARLSVRGINDLERGVRRAPRKDTVALLAEALALSPADRAAFEAAARPPAGAAADSAADDMARAATRDPRRGNLSLLLTSFVGRQQELAAVQHLLAESRLLTLTGAGGCGKTRLALEVGVAVQSLYPDGVWLVELAAIVDPALVPQAAARVLGVREQPTQPLLESLADVLRPRHLLLLLDNCEHLVVACAALAETLLRLCPRLTVLATSREALGIAGEQAWRVPSLAVPAAHAAHTVEQALAGEAVQLFVQRARQVRSGFTLTDASAARVLQLCRRLDGMPLAIELAAARLASLTLEQLAARIDDRFRLLTGGSRTALPRQQTLRATLDWSYELLGEAERLLLRRLSVFAGGWLLEAAEEVCAGEGIAAEEVLDLLAGLVHKSLVSLEDEGATGRYQVLETVRQYGQERLLASGEGELVRDRHLHWYLVLAEQAAAGWHGPQEERWLRRLDRDYANLRAALAWSLARSERCAAGAQLAHCLGWYWVLRGTSREGQRWMEEALMHDRQLPAIRRAALRFSLGLLAMFRGDHAAALALFEESDVLHRAAGDRAGWAMTLTLQAEVLGNCGQYDAATALAAQALRVHREHQHHWGTAWSLSSLGSTSEHSGAYDRAAALYRESLALFEQIGDAHGAANERANLANLLLRLGDHRQTRALFSHSLDLALTLDDRRGVAECLQGLAVTTGREGRPQEAVQLFAAAARARRLSAFQLDANTRPLHDAMLATLRAALGPERFAAAWAAGDLLQPAEAIALARRAPDAPHDAHPP